MNLGRGSQFPTTLGGSGLRLLPAEILPRNLSKIIHLFFSFRLGNQQGLISISFVNASILWFLVTFGPGEGSMAVAGPALLPSQAS